MKRAFFLFLGFSFLSTYTTIAQTWTDAEQEVWQAIVDCHASNTNKDEAASLDCFHEDYSFWWSEYVLPFSKDRVRNSHHYFLETDKTIYTDLRPAGIKVYGNTALVHWGIEGFMMDENGDRDEWNGRISMMLLKENGKWRYLGGGGSPFKK